VGGDGGFGSTVSNQFENGSPFEETGKYIEYIYIIIYIETEMQTLTFFADFEAFLDRKALNIWQIRALHQALAQLSLSILKTLLCIGS
jgi:hypothetical protein